MKRLKVFLLSLVCLSLPVTAVAQLEELEHMTIAIGGSAAESLTPNTQWYVVMNHWQYQSNTFLNDGGLYESMTMSENLDVVWSGMLAKYAAEYLVRFVDAGTLASDTHERYYLQFGTGNYINFGSQYLDVAYTCATTEEASPMYVYNALNTPCYFCFSTVSTNYRVDNYGPGGTIILDSQGEKDDISYLDDVWFLFPVTLEEVSGHDGALLELEEALRKYGSYRYSFPVGTEPGYYDADAVAAFEAALDAAAILDEDPTLSSLTEDEIYKLAQDIVDAYDAVVASMVPNQKEFEDGYYFIVSGGEAFSDDNTKAMYSNLEADGYVYAKWNTLEETCPYLWKVTDKGNLKYEVVNMATNATFDNVSTSTNVTMTVGGTNLMMFDYGPKSDDGYVYIRVSTQAEESSLYLHCSGWTGSGNYIVGWYNTEAASAWLMQAVSDEEAQAIIDAYSTNLKADAMAMIEDAEAKMSIAQDVVALITSVDQLSSPYTQSNDGQGLPALIDGNTSTYWHSLWTDGDVPAGTHYIQVELPAEYDELQFTFSRRDAASDHIIQWGVYGAPYADADKGECTWLAELYTPYGSRLETLTSDPFPTGGFTILRFYIDDTTGYNSDYVTRGYGHMSEFQLYEYTEGKLTQKMTLGDIYTDLEAAIAAAKSEMSDDISQDTYNTLKETYNAFIAAFVDPTELRAVLAEANTAVKGITIGTNPGEWSDSGTADALATTVTEVNDYDAACVYTQAQTDSYLATLQSQMEAFTDAAIKVQAGKWYELRYATEEEIEDNEWNAANGAASETSAELYGKYVAVANLIDEDGVYIIDPVSTIDLDDICVGHNLYFEGKLDMVDEDYAKFRFIAVGDAYMMQNKATGLFLKVPSTTGEVTLSVHPTLFSVKAIGFGESLLSGATLDGEAQDNLHAQLERNVLVTSSASTAGTNSGLYIEDIGEEVASDYDGTEFNMSILPGALNTFCFPVSVTANDGVIYGVELDGTAVTLSPMEGNTAEAGEPFVFVNGTLDDYNAELEAEPVPFTHGYDLQMKAQASGSLVGSYYGETIGAGKLLANGNEFIVTTSNASAVEANGAYINGSFSSADDITITISENTFDGVEQAVATVAQEGNIYSIDGRLLGKGNVNTVKALGKGIYIVGGVKVAVK